MTIRKPFVPNHRSDETILSKLVLVESRVDSMDSVSMHLLPDPAQLFVAEKERGLYWFSLTALPLYRAVGAVSPISQTRLDCSCHSSPFAILRTGSSVVAVQPLPWT